MTSVGISWIGCLIVLRPLTEENVQRILMVVLLAAASIILL